VAKNGALSGLKRQEDLVHRWSLWEFEELAKVEKYSTILSLPFRVLSRERMSTVVHH
jgi:hypothetical protein